MAKKKEKPAVPEEEPATEKEAPPEAADEAVVEEATAEEEAGPKDAAEVPEEEPAAEAETAPPAAEGAGAGEAAAEEGQKGEEAGPEEEAEPVEPAPESETPSEEPPAETVPPTPEEEPPPPPPEPEEEPLLPTGSLLLFDTWDLTGVAVSDAGLQRYINLDPVVIPHTSARHANKPFAKARTNIVERLINSMMRTERYTGKKTKTYRAVREAFKILEERTKAHPVQVLVDALTNAAPREEVTRLRFGGISVPRAVDMSPSHRLDVALRNICVGAVSSSHKSKRTIAQCLADEIAAAAGGDINSFSISKKEDMERVAASAR